LNDGTGSCYIASSEIDKFVSVPDMIARALWTTPNISIRNNKSVICITGICQTELGRFPEASENLCFLWHLLLTMVLPIHKLVAK